MHDCRIADEFPDKCKQHGSCIIWTGAKNNRGYGVVYADKKVYGAHVYSYILSYYDYDGEKCVCHKCDNPSCVNPNHLFLGTISDNLSDMHAKGRGRKKETYTSGSKHHNAKLTKEQVSEIRSLYKSGGWSWVKLAQRFGISKRCAGRLLRMETYRNE